MLIRHECTLFYLRYLLNETA